MQVGVGYLKVLDCNPRVIEEENVQIDHSRPPMESLPSAEHALKALEARKKLGRLKGRFNLDDTVDKPLLLRIPNRLGLIKRGALEDPVFPETSEPINGGSTVADPITEIGADAYERDMLHRSRPRTGYHVHDEYHKDVGNLILRPS